MLRRLVLFRFPRRDGFGLACQRLSGHILAHDARRRLLLAVAVDADLLDTLVAEGASVLRRPSSGPYRSPVAPGQVHARRRALRRMLTRAEASLDRGEGITIAADDVSAWFDGLKREAILRLRRPRARQRPVPRPHVARRFVPLAEMRPAWHPLTSQSTESERLRHTPASSAAS